MSKRENTNNEHPMTHFEQLVNLVETKEIGILTICANLPDAKGVKPSFQYVDKVLHAPIPGEVYNPDKVNVEGLRAMLTKRGIDTASDFMSNWNFPTKKANEYRGIAWAIGDKLTAPKGSGKQSAEAVYEVVWMNDKYITILPIDKQAKDAEGFIIETPRTMTKDALVTLEPVKLEG